MAGENRRIQRHSRRMALCGVMGALGVVFLMAGVLPFAAYCSPMLAMLTLLPVLDAYGPRGALGVYAVVGALGLLLSAEWEAVLLYLFLGYYPALRPGIGRLPGRLLRLGAKLAVFNIGVALAYGAAIFLFRLPGIVEELTGTVYVLTLLAMGNMTFLLFDAVLGRMERLYRKRWKKRLFPNGW